MSDDHYTPPQFESFIVRFWQERESHFWHGKAIHVSSRATCDFTTLAELEAFIFRFVVILPNPEPPDPSLKKIQQGVYDVT